MRQIEVVTFDLDNTLWDVDHVIRNAERVTRAWFDVHVPELHATLTSDDIAALRQRVIIERPDLVHNLSRLRQEVFARMIAAVGRSETEAAQLAAEAFQLFLAERHKIEYFDGALDMLEALAARHRLGALTNGNADIVRLGLDRFFRFAFSAADVGAAKPAPAIFQAALMHAGILADGMIHVGDHPIDDIHGAGQLGIHTIWVNLTAADWPDAPPPTRIVDHLTAIPAAIAAIENSR